MRTNKWTPYDMRNFCINRNFYTRGDNEAYSTMLDFVRENDPTYKNVELVAIDIICHSDRYSVFNDGDVDFIANEIWNNVIYTVDLDD